MAIGRISGSMLKSNLTRNGVDLAFETNILYLDVTNARVGIGTSSPSTALQVEGTTTTTGLVAGGLTYPTYDGSNGQVMTTNGSGVLGFTSLSEFTGITFVGDDSTGSTINTAETLKFTGGTNITTAVVNDTVTITGPDLSGYAQKTDKAITIVGDDSTGTNITIGETFKITGTSNISTAVSGDTLTITGPDLSSYLTNSTITVVGDDSTGTTLNTGETIKIAGTQNISTAVSGDTLTITGPDLSGYLTSVPKDIDVNSISSSDSSAIQINDAVNVSGTFRAATIVTNDLISEDSTAINVLDGMNVSGTLTANTAVINNINTADSSDIHINGAFVNFAGGGTVLYDEQATLNNLYDVEITNPAVDQFLRYNGTHWVNGAGAVASAGAGVTYFLTADSVTATGANNAIPIYTVQNQPGTLGESTITTPINNTTAIIAAWVTTSALNRTTWQGGSWQTANYCYVDGAQGTTTINDVFYTVRPYTAGTIAITGTGTSRTATASVGGADAPFTTARITASATLINASYLQTPQGLYQITARSSDTVVTITTPSGYSNESAVAGTVWKKYFAMPTAEVNQTVVSQWDTYTTQQALVTEATMSLGMIAFGVTTSNRTIYFVHDGVDHASSFDTPFSTLHSDLPGLQGGQANEFYHLTSAEYIGTGTGNFVRATGPTLSNPHVTGSLHVNTIDSEDSTTIEINSGVDVNGTLLAPTFITNNISSSDSSAVQIDDGLNVSGTLTANGTLNARTIVTNDISSGDSTAVQINDGLNVSGTLSADVLDVNEISSSDSTAIQINDAVNIAGALSMSGNKISNVGDPLANQDAATKFYVDSQFAASGSGTVTSITAGTGLTASPNPITTTGTISLDFSTVVAQVVGDDSTGTSLRVGETIKIAGGNNISTAVSGDTVTITGSKDINVNSISSTDSTAIQINDAVNVSGTLTSPTVVTNNISSENSTAIEINDGLNVSGTLTANTIQTNELSSTESTAIQVNDSLNASGTITAASFVTHGASGNITGVNNIEVNQISSNDSTAVQVADGMNVSGTLTAPTFVTNDISSNDSTAIQINDGLNVRGNLTATGLVANGITYPTTDGSANQVLVTNGSGVLSFTSLSGFTGITFVGDDSSGSTINTAETLKFAGASGITTAVVNDTVTITGPNLSSYLTNSTITVVGDDSTGTTLNTGETFKIAGTSGITTAVSGDTLTITGPNLSSYLTNSTITVVGDDSTGTTLNSGETIKIAGTQNITTAVSGDTLTITGPNLTNYTQKTDKAITIVGDDSTGTDVTIGETFKIAGTSNITTAVSGDTLTITGSKDIDINSISSSDSSAIQVNDSLNSSGTITAANFVTNGTSGYITGVNTLEVNEISSNDSTAVQINDGLNVRGTLTATGLVANGITYPNTDGSTGQVLVTNGSGVLSFTSLSTFTGITFVGDDSSGSTINTAETLKFVGATGITTAVVNDTVTITGPNLSGYLTSVPKIIDINEISSSDSSAIQINDAVNIAGILSVGGNVISNVSDPVANQDAATKNYVDTQLSGVSTSFYVEDGTSTITTIDSGDTLRIIGSGGITTAVSGDTLTITGANQAQGITFFDDASTSTAIPDGGTLQITSGEGISTSILGNVITITNTSTQLEIDGGSAYSVYNAISEALIDGGTA